MGFPHEVKGSGLFCYVTLNFIWIEAPLAADSALDLAASDEEPGNITFWCPSFGQGDDQEMVLEDLRLHRVDNDRNIRSVGIHKMTSTDDFDPEFPRFHDDRGCQRVRFRYTGLTPQPRLTLHWHFEVGPRRHQLTAKLGSIFRWRDRRGWKCGWFSMAAIHATCAVLSGYVLETFSRPPSHL